MSKIIFIISILFSFTTFSQSNETIKTDENEDRNIYNSSSLEVRPEFPGGIKMFYKFISSNFKIPEEIGKEKINVKIFVSFIVEKNGTISEIKVIKDAGFELGKEAIRVLKAMPKWNPGELNGNHVRSSYRFPILINTN
jgi:protein TonB